MILKYVNSIAEGIYRLEHPSIEKTICNNGPKDKNDL